MDNKKRDILFLSQFFYPEYNSSAALPFDTARYLAAHGFTVDCLTGYPKEYTNDKDLPVKDKAEGVGIKRLKYMQLGRAGRFGRLINYFSFTLRVLCCISELKNYRAVIVYSNPPILPIVPIIAKKRYGIKIIFVAYDVYPEVAYASRSLKPAGMISKVMRWINRKLYSTADCVVALTDEMRDFLLEHRPELSPDRIVTIPNWAHEEGIRPCHADYERFGYKAGQFIVSYFGNMGICQDVDTMLEAARLLKDDDRVKFLIAGHGSKIVSIRAAIKESKLPNVQVLNFLSGSTFRDAVSISSCFIVSLEGGLKGTCAPSKYYSYLHGGRPVLAVVEKDSYLASEVENEGIGCFVEIGNSTELRDAVVSLINNPKECKEMGIRAKELYKRQYAYELAMASYEAVLKKVLP